MKTALSDMEKSTIRELYAEGASSAWIASELGRNPSTIFSFIRTQIKGLPPYKKHRQAKKKVAQERTVDVTPEMIVNAIVKLTKQNGDLERQVLLITADFENLEKDYCELKKKHKSVCEELSRERDRLTTPLKLKIEEECNHQALDAKSLIRK